MRNGRDVRGDSRTIAICHSTPDLYASPRFVVRSRSQLSTASALDVLCLGAAGCPRPFLDGIRLDTHLPRCTACMQWHAGRSVPSAVRSLPHRPDDVRNRLGARRLGTLCPHQA